MKIEIYGALFKNKGAELMLRAVCKRIKDEFENGQCVISDSIKNVFIKSEQKFVSRTYPALKQVTHIVPKKILNTFNITDKNEIEYVFDASGFAYGDQWGLASSTYFLKLVKQWKKKGIRVIMLPQAFGPFTKPGLKETFIKIHKEVDHLFVRDQKSFDYVQEIVKDNQKISLAPDFTNLINGIVPSSFKHKKGIAIIPNYRMIDKTKDGSDYLNLLNNAIVHLQKINESPFFLIHEGNDDYKLANEINTFLDLKIPIYYGYNALEIKGVIGSSKLIIGSRFHGLVSSLSQGIPAIGTGWSHKYKYLFKDYNYAKGIIQKKDWIHIDKKIDKILDKESYIVDQNIILDKSELLKQESTKMWQTVFKIINLNL